MTKKTSQTIKSKALCLNLSTQGTEKRIPPVLGRAEEVGIFVFRGFVPTKKKKKNRT